MKTLVFGASGTVGSHVARELLSRGHSVRAVSRHPKKLAALGTEVEAVRCDLLDPSTVVGVFDDVEAVFLLNPVSQTEASEGLTALTAMRDSGVRRVVYLSIQQVERAPYLPHFGSKIAVQTALKASPFEWTLLRPNNFFQNDAWFRDALLQYGVYPQPLGEKGVSRVDVRDIAEMAAAALAGGHAGKTYELAGPEPMTGTNTAAIWSEVLRRPVRYAGDDLEAWEKQSLQYLPGWMVFDFKHMYGYFQRHGLIPADEDIATQTRVLGHPPRDFASYAAETAKTWAAQGAAATR